jgi:septal ring-binding cell division protein DamX
MNCLATAAKPVKAEKTVAAQAQIINMPPAKEADKEVAIEDDEDETIRIKFSWIRNTVAVAAVLLAIFLLALPTGKTEMMTRTISNLNNTILFGMMSKDTNTCPIDYKKRDIQKTMSPVDTILKKDTITKAPVVKKDSRQGYCIVLASHVSKKNANAFVEDLQKRGYQESEVYIHKNVTRVVYGNFKTQEDAQEMLRKIHHEKGLEEAWVYKYMEEI